MTYGLRDPLPISAHHGMSDGCFAYAELKGNLTMRAPASVQPAGFHYLLQREPCIRVPITTRSLPSAPSPAFDHLAGIDLSVAEREMRRVAATRVVTTVEDIDTIRDYPVEQLERKSMRVDVQGATAGPMQPSVGDGLTGGDERPAFQIRARLKPREEALLISGEHSE